MDLEDTCRTCLTKTDKVTNLNKRINLDGDELNLCDILEACTTLKVRIIIEVLKFHIQFMINLYYRYHRMIIYPKKCA